MMKLIIGRTRIIPICISFITVCSCLPAQQEKKLSFGEQEVFKVAKTSTPMVIDGKLNEEA